jgi:putative flippase GtrA
MYNCYVVISIKFCMNTCILIPSYCPTAHLIDLIKSLGKIDIVVVNDGSSLNYQHIFQEIKNIKNCTVIQHAVNLGKGRAIKTGLNYILNKHPTIPGIVVADSDGQHAAEDILQISKMLESNPDKLILGCRNFSKSIPLRSKIGNIITKFVFKLVCGLVVSDTQTGLRGIPTKFIPKCVKLSGEKYEYEINMLIASIHEKIPIIEIPIKTIYIDNNRSSHFNPIFDSFRIYFVMLRFLLSSMSTSIIDFIIFSICISMNLSLTTSTGIARIVAGNFNFFVNCMFVFKKQKYYIHMFIKYWSLVMLLGYFSCSGVHLLMKHTGIDILLAKIIVESLLFIFSFAIQRDFVFAKNKYN